MKLILLYIDSHGKETFFLAKEKQEIDKFIVENDIDYEEIISINELKYDVY